MEWGGSGRVGGMGVWGVSGRMTTLAVGGSGARAFALKSHNIFKNTF